MQDDKTRMAALRLQAEMNMRNIAGNPYPGRGIVLGQTQNRNLVQLYWAMGRSEFTRNRIFRTDGALVYTELADPAKAKDKDTSLILYAAMNSSNDFHVVSNGDQTDDVVEMLTLDSTVAFVRALGVRTYEPDAPNYTSRISGLISSRPGGNYRFQLATLRKSPFDNTCDRIFHEYENIPAGFGRCITTYSGDGDPLPPFAGDPFLVPIGDSIDSIRDTFWDALNLDNRVSLAVKCIPRSNSSEPTVSIVNKYTKVAVPAT